MLTDNFQRKFRYLRLSITDVCNFKCEYCLPDGYQCDSDRDFLTLDEIRRLVAGFAATGVSKIRLTGGEPALRKDLPEIIRAVKQTPGIETVALTTNGYNLTKKIEQWADAGLDALNVSIDSLRPEVFQQITGFDKLNEIFRGLEMAEELGIKTIKVNSVLLKGFNHNQLAEFMAWVKNRKVTMRFIELMQTGDNQEYFAKRHVSGDGIKQTLLQQGWIEKIKHKNAGPAQEFSHSDYQGNIGLIMPYSKDFCDSCNRLRISALGKLHLCLFAEQGYSVREWLQSDEQLDELVAQLYRLLDDKTASHDLHNQNTGATTHLAMLGG
ncbi:GTP 3',8-cyclase MoaA [Saccharobesus litoralis]|uniref:GTP 3',8-cyclase n=1 Tax=Saccharobesus litoralis TaxID=2172099 RepID=A0A2S0VRM0_9ALTE|nr:GTP 3',8-cyclase MoaA [Saccharobesus litoralis]AWB66861.1 GTP 3',8-cyclase MoaA [Saccharobesus litoralis]